MTATTATNPRPTATKTHPARVRPRDPAYRSRSQSRTSNTPTTPPSATNQLLSRAEDSRRPFSTKRCARDEARRGLGIGDPFQPVLGPVTCSGTVAANACYAAEGSL
jgi:hypothetical protein